jgi:hypothetical protein
MVDLGFCGKAPLGTDLGQLVLCEVQTSERYAADLPDIEAACLPADVAGVQPRAVPPTWHRSAGLTPPS